MYFGEETALTTGGERWIITKAFNTNLTDQIRVKAILGTNSSTDGSTNGYYRLNSAGRGDQIYNEKNPTLVYKTPMKFVGITTGVGQKHLQFFW